MTGTHDAPALAALYPSASKSDTPAPGSAAPKATASPEPAGSPSGAAQPAKVAEPPASPAQADRPGDPAAAIYGAPMTTLADVVAATPLPEGDAEAAGFDPGEERKAAREAVRSAFLASGASTAETSEMWGIALTAARPDYQPQSYEAAERDLRTAWGADFESRLGRAQAFMKSVARKHPAVSAEVKKLGLDNNSRFIVAVERAARRRGR